MDEGKNHHIRQLSAYLRLVDLDDGDNFLISTFTLLAFTCTNFILLHVC